MFFSSRSLASRCKAMSRYMSLFRKAVAMILCCSGLLLFVAETEGKTLGPNSTSINYSRQKSQLVKSVKKINETERVLILICGFILGVPLTVLAGCGIRAFALSMWEDYKIKAIRRNYLYRMRVATESSPR